MNLRVQLILLTSTFYLSVHGRILNAEDVQTCNQLCSDQGDIGTLINDRCECLDIDNNKKEYLLRKKRQLINQDLQLPINKDTSDERSTRCLLGSRRRMRIYDADRVAKYFINGGPSSDNSDFIIASDPTSSELTSDINEDGSVKNSYTDPTDANDSITGAQKTQTNENDLENTFRKNMFYPSPIYLMPHSTPYIPNPYMHISSNPYNPVINGIHSITNYPGNTIPIDHPTDLVGSIYYPHLFHRPLLRKLTGLHNNVLKITKIPAQTLAGARALLNDLMDPEVIRSPNEYYRDVTKNSILKNKVKNEPTLGSPISDRQSSRDSIANTRQSNMEDTSSFPKQDVSISRTQNEPFNEGSFVPLYPFEQTSLFSLQHPQSNGYMLYPIQEASQNMLSKPYDYSDMQKSANCTNDNAVNISKSQDTLESQTSTIASVGKDDSSTNNIKTESK